MYLHTTYKRPCIRIRVLLENSNVQRVWSCTAVHISNKIMALRSVIVHVLTCLP
jgi:hypothetical protein